jgi:hypothetical protein
MLNGGRRQGARRKEAAVIVSVEETRAGVDLSATGGRGKGLKMQQVSRHVCSI